jgi:hypothetical protein
MDWQDCLLDLDIAHAELASALAEYLRVPPADILVVDELTEARVADHIQLLCQRIPVLGEFRLLLVPYPRSQSVRNADCLQVFGFLSRKLRCRCLLPDSGLNPYAWLLFEHGEGPRPVFLEVEGLDRDPAEYRLDPEAANL